MSGSKAPGETALTAAVRRLIDVQGPVLTAPAPLSPDTLRRFCQATMESSPIHFDETAARAAGYSGIVAPPLYPLHAFPRRAGTPDPFDRLASDPDWDGTELVEDGLPPLELPLDRLLNGGIKAEIYGLACLGDTIACQSRYADIHERVGRSGAMVFVVVETSYRTTAGRPLLKVRTTMIAR